MQYAVKLNEEDAVKIERLHYSTEARANLLERLIGRITVVNNQTETIDYYMKEYEEVFKEYENFKDYLEKTYKPEAIADTAKSWQVNFETKEIIFEV